METSKKMILTLRMCSKDFAKLIKGEITSEQREIKPFRTSRLLETQGTFKQFEELHIKNGYKADAPLAIYEFWGIKKVKNQKGEEVFEIRFGKLKSIDHYDKTI